MRRRKSAIFFLVLGICLVALAVALNIGWILLNLQEIALLVFGIIFFALIITGLILNMIFLVREIRRNEQQDAFLNAVTHELKTPIASIKLYLETLKTRDVAEVKRAEFYDVMLADSDRLLTTVEQVLQASRTREKSRALNLSEIDINELLTESTDLIKSRHNLDDSRVRFLPVGEQISVFGDLTELKTVFGNLLDNAVKYSDTEPDISIKTRLRQNKKIIEIRIKDLGIGISGNELKTIFRRFYRVQNDSTQTAKGTGLGLFIVKSVVKKHNGRVYAKARAMEKAQPS
ncbi:MAG: HAMP domain-containing sensor histidine kinase [Pyrinomonadaceae bacterium]